MSTTARCILGKTLQTLIQQSHVKFSEDLAIPMPWKRPPLIWTKTCRNQTDGLLAVMRNKQIVKAWHHMIFTLPMRSFITLDALAAADGVGAAGSSWVCICVSPGISEKYEWWTCVKLQATLNVLVRYVCVCARHVFIDSIKFPLIQRISNTVLWLSLSLFKSQKSCSFCSISEVNPNGRASNVRQRTMHPSFWETWTNTPTLQLTPSPWFWREERLVLKASAQARKRKCLWKKINEKLGS